MVYAGHFECAKVLIANGADTEKSCEGSYPLHIVASLAALPTFKDTCMHTIQFLLEQGLSPYTECVASFPPAPHLRCCPMLPCRWNALNAVHLLGACMTAQRRCLIQR